MTAAALPPSVEYLENGITTAFAVPFRFRRPQHLQAKRFFEGGGVTTLVYGSDYSATGGSTDAGGTLTVSAAAVANTRLLIQRITPRAQEIDYTTGDTFPAESHEAGLDTAMLIAQEQDVKINDTAARALLVPEGEASPPVDLSGLLDGDMLQYRDGALQRLDRSVFAGKFYGGDATGKVVPLSGTGADSALRTDLGDGPGLSLVNYVPAGLGSVDRGADQKAEENKSIKDFGAIGDGTLHTVAEWIIPGALGRFVSLAALQVQYPFVSDTSWSIDRAAIQAAHNASKRVSYPSGAYHMGNFATAVNMIDLSNAGSGVAIITDKSVELICNTIASVEPTFFYMFGNSNFMCGHIRLRDTGYNSAITWRGATGFQLDNNTGASGNWSDVFFESIYAKNLVTPVKVSGGDATHRIRGIRIGQLYSDDCYYGYVSQNQGDGVIIDKIVAVQNYRPYFVYGAVDHKVSIFARNNRASTGAVNISRSPGGLNTKNIDVSYVAREMAVDMTHVLVNHIDLLGGEISNIKVRYNIESATLFYPMRFVNYTGSGGSETSAASLNKVFDIDIAGTCDAQARPVVAPANYVAGPQRLNFTHGRFMFLDQSVLDKFNLSEATRDAPVVWTAPTPPSIVDGSLSMSYDVVGGMCQTSIKMQFGPGTNPGAGVWEYELPYTAKVETIGGVFVQDSVAGKFREGICRVLAGSKQLLCYYDNSGTAFSPGVPHAWTNGDRLTATINVPIS
jgi:hypothetical protein